MGARRGQWQGLRRPLRSPEPSATIRLLDKAGFEATVGAMSSPRRARLNLTWISPWSVAKVSALASISISACVCAAVAGIWALLEYAGVFESAQRTVNQVLPSTEATVSTHIPLTGLLGGCAAVCLVASILAVIAAVLGSFIFNLCARLSGGVEVVLKD